MLQLGEHFKYKNEKGWDTCNKGNIVLLCEKKQKRANFKADTIENFKPFREGQKRVAVVKCIMKGKILTLTQPINW